MILFDFGFDVEKNLECELGEAEIKRFPDGEIYVRILSEIKDKECAVVKSVQKNEDFVELLLILGALKDNGAKSVNLVVPYLMYMRQDKIFKPGESLSARTVLRVLSSFSAQISLINSHVFRSYGKFDFHGVRVNNIDAFREIAQYYKKLGNPKVIAPDKGACDAAKTCASVLGCDFDFIPKKRISDTEVVMEYKDLNVLDKDVLLVDDIISTGTSIIEAIRMIEEQNPKSISVGCVHGIFTDREKFDLIKKNSTEIVSTNTFKSDVSKVDVSCLIAENLV